MKNSLTVLVVENSDARIEQVSRLLADKLGSQVFRSRSAIDALALVDTQSFDLILLDSSMVALDTLGLLQLIRMRPSAPPIVISSALPPEYSRSTALDLGALDYIEKRGRPTDLFHKIQRLILGLSKRPLDMREVKRNTSTENTASNVVTHILAELVGGVCHDVSNSLTPISAVLNWEGSPPADLARDADRCLQNVLYLIKELHTCAQSFYRREVAVPFYTGPRDIAMGLREMLAFARRNPKISLRVSVRKDVPIFAIPTLLLHQLVVPLVKNAIEATPTKADNHKGRVLVQIVPLGNAGIRLSVADDGEGWKGRVHEIEQAISKGRRIQGKGSLRGRGLQLVGRITRGIGGQMALNTTLSGGARVDVDLPELTYVKTKLY